MIPLGEKSRREQQILDAKINREHMKMGLEESRKDEEHELKLQKAQAELEALYHKMKMDQSDRQFKSDIEKSKHGMDMHKLTHDMFLDMEDRKKQSERDDESHNAKMLREGDHHQIDLHKKSADAHMAQQLKYHSAKAKAASDPESPHDIPELDMREIPMPDNFKQMGGTAGQVNSGYAMGTRSIPKLPSAVYNAGNSGYQSGTTEVKKRTDSDGKVIPNNYVLSEKREPPVADPTLRNSQSPQARWEASQKAKKGYAAGGPVHPMTGTHPTNPEAGPSDTVPAMLTPGEAVIPREAAQNPKNKHVIDALIHEGRTVQKLGQGTHAVPGYALGQHSVAGYNSGMDSVSPEFGGSAGSGVDNWYANQAQVSVESQEEEMKRQQRKVPAMSTMTQTGTTATGGTQAEANPQPTWQQIGQIESRNNPTAKNPLSSAYGIGQFIDKTRDATLAEYNTKNKTNYTAEDYKTNKDGIQNKLLEHHTNANQSILTKAGLPTDFNNTYGMHHFGAGNGMKFAKASNDTLMEDILPPEAIKANPYLKGKTKGQVGENWAKRLGQRGPSQPVAKPETGVAVATETGVAGTQTMNPDVPPIDESNAASDKRVVDQLEDSEKVQEETASLDAKAKEERIANRTADEEQAVGSAIEKAVATAGDTKNEMTLGAKIFDGIKELGKVFGMDDNELKRMAVQAAGAKLMGYNTRTAINAGFKGAMQQGQQRRAEAHAIKAEEIKQAGQVQQATIAANSAALKERLATMQALGKEQRETAQNIYKQMDAAKDDYAPETKQAISRLIGEGKLTEAQAMLDDPKSVTFETRALRTAGIDSTKDRVEIRREGHLDPIPAYAVKGGGYAYFDTDEKGNKILKKVKSGAGYSVYSKDHDHEQNIDRALKDGIPDKMFGKDGKFKNSSQEEIVTDLKEFAKEQGKLGRPNDPRFYLQMYQKALRQAHEGGEKAPNPRVILEAMIVGGDSLADPARLNNEVTKKPMTAGEVNEFTTNLKGLPVISNDGKPMSTNQFMSLVGGAYQDKHPKEKYVADLHTVIPKDHPQYEKFHKLVNEAPNKYIAFTYYSAAANAAKQKR